ncbi:M16 family metallopeptidase [Prochlorococcus marinus]|uniref:Insulinase family (Peptidase family M16) n=1 Tax=Prochlorococcus marinus (strain MIT 9211) TaxID=93059 RepID=A9BAT7_PROM4|nr:pitrilysin family protein [Prochlorococcus marinus]ABX08949.1 Insulinase family (Peptidase family M16) [Prochlorococcus marinus str. MIT 9211]
MQKLRIVLDPRDTAGIMSAKLWIKEGSRADPKNKQGLHYLLGSLLSRGCGPYNRIEIADLIEGCGAALRCDTFEDGILLSLKCTERDQSKLLPLFVWMVTAPHIASDQMSLERELSIQLLQRQKESAFHVAFDCWRRIIYRKSPYEHDPLGTLAGIAAIGEDDLKNLSTKLSIREQVLVISGSFPKKIESDIKSLFSFTSSSLKDSDVNITSEGSKEFKVDNHKQRLILRHQETSQVILILGQKTISHSHQDDLVLRLLSCHLGSGMSSLLFKKFREQYALAYETGVYHPIREYEAPFAIHVATTQEKALHSLRLLKKCWEIQLEQKISEEELFLARAKFKGNVAHNLQTVSQRAERKAQLLSFGMSDNYDNECFKRVDTISAEEIQTTAIRYLSNPLLSLCGPKKTLDILASHWC